MYEGTPIYEGNQVELAATFEAPLNDSDVVHARAQLARSSDPPIELEATRQADGTYTALFDPPAAGRYFAAFYVLGQHKSAGFLEMTVYPSPVLLS